MSRCTMPCAWAAASARADLTSDVYHRVDRQPRFCAQARTKRLAIDQLLHHVVPAVVGLTNFVDRDDVGMVQRRRGTSLAQEAFDGGSRLAALPEHLHGDGPVERGVERAVHLAHAATPEQPVNPVLGDLGADHRVSRFRRRSPVRRASGRGRRRGRAWCAPPEVRWDRAAAGASGSAACGTDGGPTRP